jgi:hypothetical protein
MCDLIVRELPFRSPESFCTLSPSQHPRGWEAYTSAPDNSTYAADTISLGRLTSFFDFYD